MKLLKGDNDIFFYFVDINSFVRYVEWLLKREYSVVYVV